MLRTLALMAALLMSFDAVSLAQQINFGSIFNLSKVSFRLFDHCFLKIFKLIIINDLQTCLNLLLDFLMVIVNLMTQFIP